MKSNFIDKCADKFSSKIVEKRFEKNSEKYIKLYSFSMKHMQSIVAILGIIEALPLVIGITKLVFLLFDNKVNVLFVVILAISVMFLTILFLFVTLMFCFGITYIEREMQRQEIREAFLSKDEEYFNRNSNKKSITLTKEDNEKIEQILLRLNSEYQATFSFVCIEDLFNKKLYKFLGTFEDEKKFFLIDDNDNILELE